VISYSEGFEPQPGEINRETADKLGLCIWEYDVEDC
jgi:hypothetical protein